MNEGHTISLNGYDQGSDDLASTSTSGTTTDNGVSYASTEEDITGLLPTGGAGINHGE